MARLARRSTDTNQANGTGTAAAANAAGRGQVRTNLQSISPSPAASLSSDKENRRAPAQSSKGGKGKARVMESPRLPTPDTEGPRSSKRRKLVEREAAPSASQGIHAKQLAEVEDKDYYDPDQSIVERRAVRKDFRDLSRELTGKSLNLLVSGEQF